MAYQSDANDLIEVSDTLAESMLPFPRKPSTLSAVSEALEAPQVQHADLVCSVQTTSAPHAEEDLRVFVAGNVALLESVMFVVARKG